jgi:dipeptide/tripeptide permease
MAYYGIASNLVIYLTEKLHQDTVEAPNNVTNWSGTVFL